jgi:DNA-binding beta-propeller fold protein YncE
VGLAEFGPQPNADFSNCGLSSGSPSGSVVVDAGGFAGDTSGGGVSTAPGPPPGVPPLPPTLPVFGASVTATVPPPPISGGTLLGLQNGSLAVASDPDRDALYVIDTSGASLLKTIALQSGDEPGRLVEDGAGRVHVALRSGGALVTIDPMTGTVLARRPVCPAPRGVAWDSTTDRVWVACATGELVALPAAGGPIATQWVVERDLRDVIVKSGAISVTKFRSAEILRLAADGTIARRDSVQPNGLSAPHVAWRAVESPTHGMLVVHQDHSTISIPTNAVGGYAFGPGGAVSSSCAMMNDATGAEIATASLLAGPFGGSAVLPVDIAISPDETYVVVALAGDGFSASAPELMVVPLAIFVSTSAASSGAISGSGGGVSNGSVSADSGTTLGESSGPIATIGSPASGSPSSSNPAVEFAPEQPIAVAFDSMGRLLVQSREPAVLHILDAQTVAPGNPVPRPLGGMQVVLSTTSRDDTGHDIFHAMAGAPIACASCHPEGGDDGHVWILDGNARRTPSLRGTIAGTAPYHWPGDEADFTALSNDVYTGRMRGQMLTSDQTTTLMSWVQTIPPPPAPSWVDSSAASRGKAIFEGPTAACSTCHSGPKLTNNQTMNVSTCGAFQVPPLVGVGWRAPLMHNGCAATFADRFGKCATNGHGSLQGLSAADTSDLTAYLDSL